MGKQSTIFPYAVVAWAVSAGWLTLGYAWAQLPSPPSVDNFSSQETFKEPAQQAIGRIELVSGKTQLFRPDERVVYPAKFGFALSSGDVIQTAQDSRCRIVLKNGDVIHLGPGSLIGVITRGADRGQEQVVNLWQGQLIAFAMPLIQGREPALVIQAPRGNVEISAGKVAVSTDAAVTNLAVFDNTAQWVDQSGRTRVLAGEAASIQGNGYAARLIPQNMEAKFAEQTNPELSVVMQGVEAFRTKDLARAKETFSQVQTSFPYDGPAAYYLGLISLQAGDLPGAIGQWQNYVKIDPEGAKQNDVQRHLTVLITQQIKDEVQYALANENNIGASSVEPNSIAVHPLNNRGDEKYRIIGKGITAMVTSDISKVPGIKVLEREKVQALLGELKLSENGLAQEDTTLRAGRLLRAEKLMIGDFTIESGREETK